MSNVDFAQVLNLTKEQWDELFKPTSRFGDSDWVLDTLYPFFINRWLETLDSSFFEVEGDKIISLRYYSAGQDQKVGEYGSALYTTGVDVPGYLVAVYKNQSFAPIYRDISATPLGVAYTTVHLAIQEGILESAQKAIAVYKEQLSKINEGELYSYMRYGRAPKEIVMVTGKDDRYLEVFNISTGVYVENVHPHALSPIMDKHINVGFTRELTEASMFANSVLNTDRRNNLEKEPKIWNRPE